jgi:hypothetical protein
VMLLLAICSLALAPCAWKVTFCCRLLNSTLTAPWNVHVIDPVVLLLWKHCPLEASSRKLRTTPELCCPLLPLVGLASN